MSLDFWGSEYRLKGKEVQKLDPWAGSTFWDWGIEEEQAKTLEKCQKDKRKAGGIQPSGNPKRRVWSTVSNEHLTMAYRAEVLDDHDERRFGGMAKANPWSIRAVLWKNRKQGIQGRKEYRHHFGTHLQSRGKHDSIISPELAFIVFYFKHLVFKLKPWVWGVFQISH